jgi:hypothetical protein
MQGSLSLREELVQFGVNVSEMSTLYPHCKQRSRREFRGDKYSIQKKNYKERRVNKLENFEIL